MRYRWSALIVVLTLILMPRVGFAQTAAGAKPPAAKLGQNYPNPFNPETSIPFTVGGFPTCTDQSHQYKVTLRIFNALMQLVAVPVIKGGAGNVAGGQPLQNVLVPCGQYVAYWNGNYLSTSKEAASGIYMAELNVDAQRFYVKMIVMK